MSQDQSIGIGHVSDGDLMRYVDGVLTPREGAAVVAHLAGCGRCSAELGELRQHVRRFGEVVSHLDHIQVSPERRAQAWATVQRAALAQRKQARARWFTTPRIAAATVLLAVGVVGARPVLAWVVDHVDRLVHGKSGSAPHTTVSTPAPAVPRARDIRLLNQMAFVPTAARFPVSISGVVAGDTLELMIQDGSKVTVRYPSDAAVQAMPSGMKIGAVGRTPHRYVVAVPLSVREVRLSLDGGAEMVLGLPQSGATSVFALQALKEKAGR